MTNNAYRVIVSREAYDMIKEHIGFLANVSVSAAKMLYHDLYTRFKQIEETPFMYPIYLEESEAVYRKSVFKRYLILYTVNEAEKLIEIEYVWDSRRMNEI
jgi:plasmid stabilization system protein ParE